MAQEQRTRHFRDVAVGTELPALAIPVTTTLIVAGAIASRDYQVVHHDTHAAQRAGTPDIIMNILTTNGLVGRFVTEWAGPEARLQKVAIKLGAPNLPGDTMTLAGRVVAADAAARAVEVEVTGKNSMGNHVTGTVRVALAEG
ncbi:MAG: MaoC/PaaZ C-terminal domain-containing protein [Candidatus Binatia bacterium]